MVSSAAEVTTALRLGWAVAEVRGRAWPDGPRPSASVPELHPPEVLPLRSQRRGNDAIEQAKRTLVTGAVSLGLSREGALGDALADVVPVEGADGSPGWPVTAAFFLTWDAWFQDELAQRDEALANAYLLGRGLAECYWGLGPAATWAVDGRRLAVSPAFLLGLDRRRELSRMLGRLDPALTHETTPAAISGSLEAWGAVAEDDAWSDAPGLPVALYEQVRRWYQLVVLAQDPTTLIGPYAKLTGLRGIGRAARLFWPQLALFIVAFGLVTGFFTVWGGSAPTWVRSLLATSGFGIFLTAGLLARGQSAAQKLLTRLRQDAYTDLVAVSITVVPDRPSAGGGTARARARSARTRLEALVRRRSLTTPTPPPT